MLTKVALKRAALSRLWKDRRLLDRIAPLALTGDSTFVQELEKFLSGPAARTRACIAAFLGPLAEGLKLNDRAAVCARRLVAWSAADLSPVVPALEAALKHPSWEVRRDCSWALSRHFARIGKEPDLGGATIEALGTMAVYVSHRPLCGGETAVKVDPRLGPAGPCRVCRSDETQWTFYREDSGPGWKIRQQEVRCTACGKFTLYDTQD